jgi:Xaa-Pro aminopeptidase
MNRLEEVSAKLKFLRDTLKETESAGIRLRGTDWFAWATAGGSNTVLLAAETGVAEVLVTATDAWILTDEIEAQRLKDEEIPHSAQGSYQFSIHPWAEGSKREAFIREATSGGKILSDKPSHSIDPSTSSEAPLPASLLHQKRTLLPVELERYRQVGRLASEAMTEVLNNAQPDWTEYQLAGAGAAALWQRGLHPTLTLAAGERRLPLYRHPTPNQDAIGRQAMLVFCARGYGLYANLTRFVCFGSLPSEFADRHQQVMVVEAAALDRCQPDTPLNAVYQTLAEAYHREGYPNAIREHHQGGTTGYLAREIVATPNTTDTLAANMAIAWNPSLVGAKVEDTFVISADGKLENLTFDPNWQSAEIEGRLRPIPLER